jgi:hypothetical protein
MTELTSMNSNGIIRKCKLKNLKGKVRNENEKKMNQSCSKREGQAK